MVAALFAAALAAAPAAGALLHRDGPSCGGVLSRGHQGASAPGAAAAWRARAAWRRVRRSGRRTPPAAQPEPQPAPTQPIVSVALVLILVAIALEVAGSERRRLARAGALVAAAWIVIL